MGHRPRSFSLFNQSGVWQHVEGNLLAGLAGLKRRREGFIEQKYIKSLLANPDDHARRIALAKTLIESERYTEAISNLSMLVATDVAAEALYNIGYAYAGMNRFDDAVRYMDKAVAADPLTEGYARSADYLRS
ncbi:MAG: tetratricopeptide (TPR) repeat protein, partial [Candidatus Latescibacterota bacterium]